MKNWVITLKQFYAMNIMAGNKTVELRTRVPSALAPGDRIFVSIAGTGGSVLFSFRVSFLDTQSSWVIWSLYRDHMLLHEDTFWSYAGPRHKMTAIGVEDVRLLPSPANVKDFGLKRSPQWFANYEGLSF